MKNRPEKIIDLSKDKEYPLKGYIVLFNTKLGPALGGTRIFNYKDNKSALLDAKKLSKAMTYKTCIAGLRFGGGKGVIIADPKSSKLKKLLKNYAYQVKKLNGKFYTGEDVGLTFNHVQEMLKYSPYFIGKAGQAGDPSEFAALSAYYCIKWMTQLHLKLKTLKSVSIGIKGVGKTGIELLRLLQKDEARVFYYDIDQSRINIVKKKYPKATYLPLKKFEKYEFTIFAPCAMGNDINKKNINQICSKMIIGTANNQLGDIKLSDKLKLKGILHVPDYIANAGGVLNVADELLAGGYKKSRVLRNISKLKPTLKKVYLSSMNSSESMDRIANKIVEKTFISKHANT